MDPDDLRAIDAGAGAADGRSRVSGLQAVPRVLQELGFDPTAVLAEIGIDAGLFADPNNLAPDGLLDLTLRHCAARTGCDEFAFRAGQHAGLASLGLVGALAQSAPDVGTALRTLTRFLSLNDGAAVLSVSAERHLGALHYAIYEAGLEGAGHIYQLVSAVACNVLRELCGPEWEPHEVWLPYRRPRDTRPFRDFFRAPLRFDAHRMTLVFPQRWLGHPLRGADAERHEVLSARAVELERLASPGFPSQVRRAVRSLLLESRGSIEDVASRFSMHRRTLDRHLDANGVSFRTLADEVRFEVACQLLRDTQMSISEIAAGLYYGDGSAFAHAFRRWSGRTPTQWRASASGIGKTRSAGSLVRSNHW